MYFSFEDRNMEARIGIVEKWYECEFSNKIFLCENLRRNPHWKKVVLTNVGFHTGHFWIMIPEPQLENAVQAQIFCIAFTQVANLSHVRTHYNRAGQNFIAGQDLWLANFLREHGTVPAVKRNTYASFGTACQLRNHRRTHTEYMTDL